jgi:hypothetical protein
MECLQRLENWSSNYINLMAVTKDNVVRIKAIRLM